MVGSGTVMNETGQRQVDQEAAEARDPATPGARLAALTQRHLEAVLQNPATQLVLLENPDWWDDLPRPVLDQIARSPTCPPAFLAWVNRATFGFERAEVALNPVLPLALRREAFLGVSSGLDPKFWLDQRDRL